MLSRQSAQNASTRYQKDQLRTRAGKLDCNITLPNELNV